MKSIAFTVALAAAFTAPSATLAQKAAMTTSLPAPPKAEARPYSYERHGVRVEDPYAWLRDKGYPKVDDRQVLDYLKAENAYFEAAMKPHAALTEEIFQEMKGRIKEDDSSVPIKDGDWLYWSAFKEGTQYRDWFRKPAGGGAETLIFSENAEAEGKEYFRLGAFSISPDGKRLATLVDDDGSERFKLVVRDLATGKDLETVTEVGIGNPVWTSDSRGLVFTEVNDQWRSYRARYHVIGQPLSAIQTLYEEKDDIAFSVGVDRTTDNSFIVISTGNNSSNEIRFVPADKPDAPLTLIRPRQADMQYEVDSSHGKLWFLTNDKHVNFRIVSADPGKHAEWTEVVAGSERTYLRGISAHRDHLLITNRVDGLDQLVLRDYASGKEERVPFKEASYSASFAGNPEYAPASYRLGYSSMVTPQTVYDYHPASKQLETRKVQEIPSGYDPGKYVTERMMITARDGKQVPVSIVRLKESKKDGQAVRLWLWRLRLCHPAKLLDQPAQPGRSRVRLCHRPHPRRRRPWLPMVPGRQA
jgi:oligopeptidase B